MKIKRSIKRFIKRKKILIGLTILAVLPIVIGAAYALPLPKIIVLDSGDLLAYYGAAFGIIGSFAIYRGEIKERKKEKLAEIKPSFVVEVMKKDDQQDTFIVNISNKSIGTIMHFFFYEKYISAVAPDKCSYLTIYNKDNSEIQNIKYDYNVTEDPDIIDNDGFPKYVLLSCDDKEGNSWSCYYFKVKDGDKIFYYPRDFEMV